jgi:probable F420-dependent oxidoreductase
MQIGTSIPTTEIGTDPIKIRDFVQAIEGMGYKHLTLIDHVLQSREAVAEDWRSFYTLKNMFHEPMTFLAYVAALTTKIQLTTAILILPQRQTALVAKQAAQIDILSGGRMRLGVGIGWNKMEFDALHENFGNRGRRIEEQIDVLRQLWSNPVVNYDGEWHKIEDAGINPLPIQRPIPVWIGGFVEPAIARAGRIADGLLANPRTPAGDEGQRHYDIFCEAATKAGRDIKKLGFEATVLTEDRGPQAWAADADTWKQMGATHLTVRTMASGLSSNDEHLAQLQKFVDNYPV